MKKLFGKIIMIFFICSNLIITTANAEPFLDAKGVVLLDGITGKVLFAKNADVQYEPASTTKVMTALLTVEKCNLDDKVTIGENPPFADGSSIGIQKGEVYTVRELLLGLLLESGNDTAEALAEHVSGSSEAFAVLMTEKAKELGANNTTFKNPSGLHQEGHLTTAYDLSLIMRAAYNNPSFNEIAKAPFYFYKDQPYSNGSEKWATNRNHCINPLTPYYYEYCYSGKVGYTPEANHTYTASAVKNGQVLIASFLNAENKDAQFSSVGPLFEYGFENFETIKLVSIGDKVADYTINNETIIPLLSNKEFYYNKPKNAPVPLVTYSYDTKDYSRETISKGQSLFDGNILLDGEVYGNLSFIGDADREYTFKLSAYDSIEDLKQNKIALIGIAVLILGIVALLITLIIKFKKHMSNRE